MTFHMVEARGVEKRIGDQMILKGVDFNVRRGEVVSLIGPSGSGKSTFLRCINHLTKITSGYLAVDGEPVGYRRQNGKLYELSDAEIALSRAEIGMVFQRFNLFGHKTAIENIIEGPVQVRKQPIDGARQRARLLLDRVGLADKAETYPAHLSGGQKQRVAIARALALDPELLLFDEPTSALDPELVGEVLTVIRSLAEEGRTMLLVTHELGFAYHVATRVIFLADGTIHEQGTPDEVLKHPKKERTQSFLARHKEFSL